MIIAKGEEPHTRQPNKQTWYARAETVYQAITCYYTIQNNIHQPIMLWLLKQYTRLGLDSSELHIIRWDSADACTCGGLSCSPPS